MRCKTQCREKIAACEPERGTRHPGEATHLEAREGFAGDFSMSYVLVINQQKQPCQPVHPAQARRLLSTGKAVVYRRFPFVLRLKEVQKPPQHALRLKIDPGAKTTGMAIVNDENGQVLWAAEISHRGEQVREHLAKRRAVRRARRQRTTRYRPARWRNRRRPHGWLAPSLMSRMGNVLAWTARLRRWCPLGSISLEVVRFDTQALQHPEVAGIAYQQGTLFGYEIRGYLLEKWGRRCGYCGATNTPLQIDHVVPKAREGSDRVSNLVLACEACNLHKGNQDVRAFLADQPERLERILAQLKTPLPAAAAVNATRWRMYEDLLATGLPVETSTGGRTQYNRMRLGLPKQHWIDAATTRASTPDSLRMAEVRPWLITATGRQKRQMVNVDEHGFPRGKAKGPSCVRGFRTGDLVKAVCPAHLGAAGTHIGRVLVRTRGIFDVVTRHGRVRDIPARCCRSLHRKDGYAYQLGAALPPHA